MSQATENPVAGNQSVAKEIDFSTESGVKRFLTPKPAKTKATVVERSGLLGLEYPAGSALRHKDVQQKMGPAFLTLVGVCILIFCLKNALWALPVGWLGLWAICRLNRSLVHIAVTEDSVVVEEESRFYNQQMEIHRDEIACVMLASFRSKHHVDWQLRIYRHDETYFTFPDADREELNWLSFEISDRLSTRRVDQES